MFIIVFVCLFLSLETLLADNEKWIVSLPKRFPAVVRSVESSSYEKMMKMSRKVAGTATDSEGLYAMRYLFYGKKGGVAMELGALAGTWHTHSETIYFSYFDWGRVLVEARPKWRENLQKLQGNIYSVQAAICSTAGTVHYAERHYSSGIVEFMSPAYLKKDWKHIWKLNSAAPGEPPVFNWTEVPSDVITVDCIPLSLVLSQGNVKYVDWFVLDVEGAELDILHTIDWDTVEFGVICIETFVQQPGYDLEVIKFMESKGYLTIAVRLGRNSWFMHKNFKPSIQGGHENTNPFNCTRCNQQ